MESSMSIQTSFILLKYGESMTSALEIMIVSSREVVATNHESQDPFKNFQKP
jgi:hypothetical protein